VAYPFGIATEGAMTQTFAANGGRKVLPNSALAEAIRHKGIGIAFRRDEEIYAQDEDVDWLFRVVSGVVRTSRLTADGRRQVGGFYYAGDIVGLETDRQHLFSAEALTNVEVQAIRRSAVRAFAGDVELDRAILDATRLELVRAQSHMLMLSLKNAREKVAAFLVSLVPSGQTDMVEMAMSRQDIADYLGLTIETVSRMLSQLQDEALVEFPSTRRFVLPRRAALEALAA
jgi:CRP/FNR family nitrogen fixation transcriptional regulator